MYITWPVALLMINAYVPVELMSKNLLWFFQHLHLNGKLPELVLLSKVFVRQT